MTIEPGYIPNQDPEPGEIVRFETPSETLAAARAASADTDGQQFVEETISPPEFELAPEPGEESSPADAVLAKLFGEPLDEAPSSAPSAATEGTPAAAAPALEASPAPAGPVQPEHGRVADEGEEVLGDVHVAGGVGEPVAGHPLGQQSVPSCSLRSPCQWQACRRRTTPRMRKP